MYVLIFNRPVPFIRNNQVLHRHLVLSKVRMDRAAIQYTWPAVHMVRIIDNRFHANEKADADRVELLAHLLLGFNLLASRRRFY